MTLKEERALVKMREALDRLEMEGIPFEKLTPHHIKVGNLSFWPSSGKCAPDGAGSEVIGLDGFIARVRGPVAKTTPKPSLHIVPKVPPETSPKVDPEPSTRQLAPTQQPPEAMKFGTTALLMATTDSLAARNAAHEAFEEASRKAGREAFKKRR